MLNEYSPKLVDSSGFSPFNFAVYVPTYAGWVD